MNIDCVAPLLRRHGLQLAIAATVAMLGMDASARPEPAFEQAVGSYRSGRFSESFGRFLALARRGDADAARIVLFMNQYGPQLYGSYWDLSGDDIEDLNRVAAVGNHRRQPEFRPSWEAQPVSTQRQQPRRGTQRARPVPAR